MWSESGIDKRRVRKGWMPLFASGRRRWTKVTSPTSATILLSSGREMEANHSWFSAGARSPCFSGWCALRQSANCLQFFRRFCAASVKESRWARSRSGHGERYHHRVCQHSPTQLMKERNFLAARAVDFLFCGACLRSAVPSLAVTHGLCPPENMNCGEYLGNNRTNTCTSRNPNTWMRCNWLPVVWSKERLETRLGKQRFQRVCGQQSVGYVR